MILTLKRAELLELISRKRKDSDSWIVGSDSRTVDYQVVCFEDLNLSAPPQIASMFKFNRESTCSQA